MGGFDLFNLSPCAGQSGVSKGTVTYYDILWLRATQCSTMQYCSWEKSQSACSSWAEHRSQSLGVRQGFRRLQQSLRRLRRPFLSWVAGYPDAHVQLLRLAGRFKWEKTTSAATMQLTICTIPSELQSAVQKSHQVPSSPINHPIIEPGLMSTMLIIASSSSGAISRPILKLTILAKDGITGMTGMTMKTT